MSWIREARFWSKVDVGSKQECWPFLGGRTEQGYGRVGQLKAHRLAYEYAKGKIPKGLCVMHSCDNPPCCNPAHLTVGTYQDNAADMVRKGRNYTATGLRNGNAKLSDGQVAEIRAANDNLATLSKRYGIARSTVSMIRRGLRR